MKAKPKVVLREGSMQVKPGSLFQMIIKGYDVSNLFLPLKVKQDFKSVRVSLTVSLRENGQMIAARHVLKIVPVERPQFASVVIEVFEKLENTITKAYIMSKKAKEIEDKLLDYEKKNLSEKDILRQIELNSEHLNLEDQIDNIEEEITILYDKLLYLMRMYNPEIHDNLFEISLKPEKPIKIMISEITCEHVEDKGSVLVDALKSEVMKMKVVEGNEKNE